MAKASTAVAGHLLATDLARRYGLRDWTARRELATAVSVGAVRASRVGRCWLLPVEQLAAFADWLRRRGLLAGEAPEDSGPKPAA